MATNIMMTMIMTNKTRNPRTSATPLFFAMAYLPEIPLPPQRSLVDLPLLSELFVDSGDLFSLQERELQVPDDWIIRPDAPHRPFNRREAEELEQRLHKLDEERKLLLGVLQFLTYYWTKEDVTILYFGYSSHWRALCPLVRFFQSNELRSRWRFILVKQPGDVTITDPLVEQIKVIDDEVVESLRAPVERGRARYRAPRGRGAPPRSTRARITGDLIFISNHVFHPHQAELRRELIDDLNRHRHWIDILNPLVAMIKLHLPYPRGVGYDYNFAAGELYVNFYAKATATDLRVVVPRQPAGRPFPEGKYNDRTIEQQVFYHNYVVKSAQYSYGPYTIPRGDPDFDQSFDSVSEVYIFYGLMQKFAMDLTLENFTALRNYFYDAFRTGC